MTELFATIESQQLEQVGGGLNLKGQRESYNVEDLRPGAPPLWAQKVQTWWHNFQNGYLY